MHIAIITNETIKNQEQLDKNILDELAFKYDFTYELYICKPDKIAVTIKDLLKKQVDLFLVAGGDGTIRTAAQTLQHQDTPLAILSLGTFNHFAKELNLPQNLADLIKLIKLNKLSKVDIAEVNDIVFLNNSSIGFYSNVIKLKEKYSNIFGQNKLLKIIFTAFNIFKTIPVYTLNMQIDNKNLTYHTCLVFVGNNYYYTDPIKLGTRESLSAGLLSVYILKCQNRWEIFQCIFSMLFNTFNKKKYLSQYMTTTLTITAPSKYVNIIIDGELFRLESPLTYLIHPKKLLVVTP